MNVTLVQPPFYSPYIYGINLSYFVKQRSLLYNYAHDLVSFVHVVKNSHTEILISENNQTCSTNRNAKTYLSPNVRHRGTHLLRCVTKIRPPSPWRKMLSSISNCLFVCFNCKASSTDVKCQLFFFSCQKESHSFQSTKAKGQMPLIKLLGVFLFWFERVWHFKQLFLFHSLLLAYMDCLFQTPVIDIKHKVGNDLNGTSPQLCAPSLVSSYHLLHTDFEAEGSYSGSWL